MVLPAGVTGFQFVNVTTVCYFAASLGGHYYMHPSTSTPPQLAMGDPDWNNFGNWVSYRFRMYLFKDRVGTRYTAIRSDHSNQYINHQSNTLQLMNDQTSVFRLQYGGGNDKAMRVTNTSSYMCSSGVNVNIVSHACYFRCYPVVTLYGSDVVQVTTKDGKILIVVQGQVVVVDEKTLNSQAKKRSIKQYPQSQKEETIFVMDKYKYDLGTHVLHAATFRNIKTNFYLQCSLDSNQTVSKLGITRKQKDNKVTPGPLSEPDSRFFILEILSPSTVYLRCHEDPGKIVNASLNGFTTTIDASKTNVKTEFILKRPELGNFNYEAIRPIGGGKPTDLCINSAPSTLTVELALFFLALFLVV